jgi:hypothetical protein
MADPDRSISNGTCVFASGIRTDKIYIPCGNAAFGDVSCCVAGDFCLENNACFSPKYGTTYLAGCTDIDYESPTCPDKREYDRMTMATMTGCVARNADHQSPRDAVGRSDLLQAESLVRSLHPPAFFQSGGQD